MDKNILEQIKKEFISLNEKRNIIHISIIGVETVIELKRKIYTHYLLNEDLKNETNKQISQSLRVLVKEGIKIVSKASGIGNELANITEALWDFHILTKIKGKTIVIDDIERKSDKFHIDSLMGTIDTIKENNKVILLLNENQLNKENWDNLKEKIIDEYLSFDIEVDECLNIICPEGYSHDKRKIFKKIFTDFDIKNLRIGKKIFTKMDSAINEINIKNYNLFFNFFVILGKFIFLKTVDGEPQQNLLEQIKLSELENKIETEKDRNQKQKNIDEYSTLLNELKDKKHIILLEKFYEKKFLKLLQNETSNIKNTIFFIDFLKIERFLNELENTLESEENLQKLYILYQEMTKGLLQYNQIFARYNEICKKNISFKFNINIFLNTYKLFSQYNLNLRPLQILIKRNYIKFGQFTHYIDEGVMGDFRKILILRENRKLFNATFDQLFRYSNSLFEKDFKILNTFSTNEIINMLERGDIYHNVISAKIFIEDKKNNEFQLKVIEAIKKIKEHKKDSTVYHICKAHQVFKLIN